MPEPREPVCLDDLRSKSNILEGLCYALDEVGIDCDPRMRNAQTALIVTVAPLAREIAVGLDNYLTFQHGKEGNDDA